MFEGLEKSQLTGALEALLFVSDEPIDTLTLAQAVEVETTEAQEALIALRDRLERENAGVQLREVAGGWRLYTHPAYHELVQAYVLSWDTRRMSQAALETLAIVAYAQPVTRAEIASVRGVNADSPLNTLIERGYVREAGQSEAPGNPMLYATTKKFLEKFGLGSPRDLPPLEDYAPDEKTARLIAERLGAVSQAAGETAGGAVADAGRADAAWSDGGGTGGARGMRGDADAGGAIGMAAGASAAGAGDAAGDARTARTDGAAALSEANLASPESLVAQAESSLFGVVDKIDFSKLNFDTDDE